MNCLEFAVVVLIAVASVDGRNAPLLPARSATVLKDTGLGFTCTGYCNEEELTIPKCYGATVFTCESDGNDVMDICIGNYTQTTTSNGIEHNYCNGLYYSTTTQQGKKTPTEAMQCAGDLDLYFATGSESPVVQYKCDGYEADEAAATGVTETCKGTCDGEDMISSVCKGKFVADCTLSNAESWSYVFSCDGVFSGSMEKGSCTGSKSFVLKGSDFTLTQTCSNAFGYENGEVMTSEACQGAYTSVTEIAPSVRISA